MKKSRRRSGGASGLLMLFFLVLVSTANPQEPATSAAPPAPSVPATPAARAAWVLGCARFVQVSQSFFTEAKDGTEATDGAGGLSLENFLKLSAEAEKNALDTSLPLLLAAELAPLPPRYDSPSGTEGPPAAETSIETSLWAGYKEGRLLELPRMAETAVEPAPADPALAGADLSVSGPGSAVAGVDAADGFLTGLYSIEGERLEVQVYGYEGGKSFPSFSGHFVGDIAGLAGFPGSVLPGILSWTARRPLGIVDVVTKPADAAVAARDDFAGNVLVRGKRIFIMGDGQPHLSVSREGYEQAVLSFDETYANSYKKMEITLAASGALAPTTNPAQSDILKWNDKSAFKESTKKFQSSLGRFIVSVPFSVLSVGSFLLYNEAYSRSSSYATAMYASGAASAVCLAISAGFVIDLAVKLVQVLKFSR